MPSCFYRPAEDGTGAGLVLCSRGYGYATSRYIFYRPAEDGTGAGLILIPTSNLNPKTRPNPNPDPNPDPDPDPEKERLDFIPNSTTPPSDC